MSIMQKKEKAIVEMISIEKALFDKLLLRVKMLETRDAERGNYILHSNERIRAKYAKEYSEAVMSLEQNKLDRNLKPQQQIIPQNKLDKNLNININVYPNIKSNNSGHFLSRLVNRFLPSADNKKHLEIKSETA